MLALALALALPLPLPLPLAVAVAVALALALGECSKPPAAPFSHPCVGVKITPFSVLFLN